MTETILVSVKDDVLLSILASPAGGDQVPFHRSVWDQADLLLLWSVRLSGAAACMPALSPPQPSWLVRYTLHISVQLSSSAGLIFAGSIEQFRTLDGFTPNQYTRLVIVITVLITYPHLLQLFVILRLER